MKKKSLKIIIISLILFIFARGIYIKFNPEILLPKPVENTMNINENLKFVSISSNLISLVLKENNTIIVPATIKKFAIEDSRLYLIQKPNDQFLKFNINDNEEIKFE